MKLKNIFLFAALGGTLLWSACQQSGPDASATNGPAHYTIPDSVKVPFIEAKHLVDNYAPHAGTVERGKDSLPDTRAIWFELERLEALVAQIRREGGDGIRFYLATYDDSYPADAQGAHVPQRTYWGYNTLLMVSTKDSTVNGRTFHRDYFTETHGKGVVLKAEAENRGDICPPPGDCYAVGALLLGNLK